MHVGLTIQFRSGRAIHPLVPRLARRLGLVLIEIVGAGDNAFRFTISSEPGRDTSRKTSTGRGHGRRTVGAFARGKDKVEVVDGRRAMAF
jgi:hypothetical protein